MQNRNKWGTAASGVDPQRSDLFRVILELPGVLGGQSGWNEHIEFAVKKFPFPERSREMIPVKFLNQTNHVLGADTAVGQVDIGIRYAFNARTIELLEKWHTLTSNPYTGGVGLTTRLKSDGWFVFLVPDHEAQINLDQVKLEDGVLKPGAVFRLEGCLVKGLRYSDADMEAGNQIIEATFSLQIDRYYPDDLNKLAIQTQRGNISGAPSGLNV